ncbi:unnamed protein product [Larinioides sclopetarius]|uniref:Uncharacterized protein n=1 Tax=Larinioides sclopetarius TaxID=280406 RepID=A0AAV1YZ51_9ARAC
MENEQMHPEPLIMVSCKYVVRSSEILWNMPCRIYCRSLENRLLARFGSRHLKVAQNYEFLPFSKRDINKAEQNNF